MGGDALMNSNVVPAKAGTSGMWSTSPEVPAFAGTTDLSA
jgi:hypothetical protein